MNRKDFTKTIDLYPNEKNKQASKLKKKTLCFPINSTGMRTFDFSRFYGRNCDEIVVVCQHQIECFLETSLNTEEGALSITTIAQCCQHGVSKFIPYCSFVASELGRPLILADIDKLFIERFIKHLSNGSSKQNTAQAYYCKIKPILIALGRKNIIARNIFPKNPYPNSNRESQGEKVLSSREQRQLVHALKSELKILFDKRKKSIDSFDASICLLAIALRTGRNTTPLLELPINCLQEHPLKPNRKLLVTYKRRGNSTHLTALRKTSKHAEVMTTIMPDVEYIIQKLIDMSGSIRKTAPIEYQQRLFLYKSMRTAGTIKMGSIVPLTKDALAYAINKIIKKYSMTNDNGKPLKLNVSRLRKTFVNRLWILSGNDPFVTAKLAGHTLKISNGHYLQATQEMVKNWRLMGEIRTEELLTNEKNTLLNNFLENTPVGHCKDPKQGHLAPKNGEYCAKFLSCFRCRSYVITGNDLYRLFSFYWLLVRERDHIGTRKWSQYYAHIIRIIDQQISPQFDKEKISENRTLAKENPHPFWRSRKQIMEFH